MSQEFGLRIVDRAVGDAVELTAAFGTIRGLVAPIFVFSVRDRITGSDGPRSLRCRGCRPK